VLLFGLFTIDLHIWYKTSNKCCRTDSEPNCVFRVKINDTTFSKKIVVSKFKESAFLPRIFSDIFLTYIFKSIFLQDLQHDIKESSYPKCLRDCSLDVLTRLHISFHTGQIVFTCDKCFEFLYHWSSQPNNSKNVQTSLGLPWAHLSIFFKCLNKIVQNNSGLSLFHTKFCIFYL